jgi:hypothetical protein
MTGHLARHIAQRFRAFAGSGAEVTFERTPIPDARLRQALGYTPSCDLLVARADPPQRLWIELEISRADPVANHAKFATVQLVETQSESEVFVSLMSRAIDPGRRSLGAHAVYVLRRLGMRAYQAPLLPRVDGYGIKRLNHLPRAELADACPDLRPEWDRLLAITRPALDGDHRILFACDDAEIVWNAARWNAELPGYREAWGRRRVEHFVAFRDVFAPAKFCAFVPADGSHGMTIALYVVLDESEPRFDGHRAWTHLQRIGWERSAAVCHPGFGRWLQGLGGAIAVPAAGPTIWAPPA